jgi:hypothetical protein
MNKLDYEADIEEGFCNLNQDIALKAIIFGMLFYIVESKLVEKLINNYLPVKLFGTELLKTLVFVIFFYIISVNIA